MINRRLALLGGVGAAGFIGRAQADQNFTSFQFNTISGTNARTDPERWNDIINVRDYGATGDGVTDDGPAIQAAIDKAFGTAGSPNGTNAYLNRPLFIPGGNYRLRSGPLVFTQVQGGHIFGAGQNATRIWSDNDNLVRTDGFEFCNVENIEFGGRPGAGGGEWTFELDWLGGGSVGLEGNIFTNCNFEGGDYAFRIAKTGNGGAGTQFYGCNSGDANTRIAGIVTWSAGAIATVLIGGGCSGVTAGSAVWVRNGQVSCVSNYSLHQPNTSVDFLIASANPILIKGCRTETNLFCNITSTSALVTLQAIKLQPPALPAVMCNVAGTAGVGAKVILDTCSANDTAYGGGERLTNDAAAQGTVYARANDFNAGFFTGFAGTLAENI